MRLSPVHLPAVDRFFAELARKPRARSLDRLSAGVPRLRSAPSDGMVGLATAGGPRGGGIFGGVALDVVTSASAGVSHRLNPAASGGGWESVSVGAFGGEPIVTSPGRSALSKPAGVPERPPAVRESKAAVIRGLAVPYRTLSGLRVTNGTDDGRPHRILFLPGAFTKALASGRDRVALMEHDPTRVLAYSWNGNLRFWEEGAGLAFEFAARTDLAVYAAYRIDSGDLNGASVAYKALSFRWSTSPEGEPLKVIREAELSEVSLLREPAFAGTYLKTQWLRN